MAKASTARNNFVYRQYGEGFYQQIVCNRSHDEESFCLSNVKVNCQD